MYILNKLNSYCHYQKQKEKNPEVIDIFITAKEVWGDWLCIIFSVLVSQISSVQTQSRACYPCPTARIASHFPLSHLLEGFPGGSVVKNPPAKQEMWVWSLGQEDPGKKMGIHSNILAWEIPWTEEPGGLQFMGSQGVGHDLATEHALSSWSSQSSLCSFLFYSVHSFIHSFSFLFGQQTYSEHF